MELKARTTEGTSSGVSRVQAKKVIVNKRNKKIPPLLKEGAIFWAVDPFEIDVDAIAETLLAAHLFNKENALVRPVSVVSPIDMGWPIAITPSVQKKIYQATVENIQRLRESPNFSNVGDAEVIVEARATRQQAAQAVLKHIGKQKTKMIVLNTHGRRGLRRLRLGSFTEMLLSLSPYPVLVAGPESMAPESVAKVFFPTDLTKSSQKVFASLVPWAKEKNAKVVLYHIENPIPPASISPWVNEIWERELKSFRKRAHRWASDAKKAGVDCEVVIDRGPGDIGTHAAAAAEHAKADLIVMGIRANPWEQTFFGHNTRTILAEASCPVLVIKNDSP